MALPLSDRARAWDASAATKRVAAWATSGDSINFSKYGQAFAIKGDGKTQGSYKLPFADVINGALTAVWSGVTAAAGALQGARGGVDATDAAKASARSTLAGYYAAARVKFSDPTIKAPWDNKAAGSRETRSAAITEIDPDEHGFWAKLVSYGPADSFNTRWAPGVFDDSVRAHKPVLAWGHDWSDPIGRMDDYQDRADGPYAHFRLDDGDYVPRARQALYQLHSGTLTDVSVGILRKGADPTADDGTTTITRADLDEVSLVLRGAVPGAQVMAGSVRSARGGIAFDDVIALAQRVRSGEITHDDALAAIDLLGGQQETVSTGVIDEPPAGVAEEAIVPADVAAALAEADAVDMSRARR